MNVVDVVVDVVVVFTLTRIIKSVVTGQAPVTLEWRNTPGKKTQSKPKVVHAYIIADAIHASARKYKSEIESQPTICQVHTGAYVHTRGCKNRLHRLHPEKTTTYTLRAVPITTHAHIRLKSIGKKRRKEKKRQKNEKKEKKRNKRKENERKRKEKKEKERREKKRREKKRREKKRREKKRREKKRREKNRREKKRREKNENKKESDQKQRYSLPRYQVVAN